MRAHLFAGAVVAALSVGLGGCDSSGPKDFQGLLLEDVQNPVIVEISRWADLTSYDGTQNLADFDFVVVDADNHAPAALRDETLADEAVAEGIPAIVTDATLAHAENLGEAVGFQYSASGSIEDWGIRSQFVGGTLAFQYGMQAPYDTFLFPPNPNVPPPIGPTRSCLDLTALSSNTVTTHTAAVWERVSDGITSTNQAQAFLQLLIIRRVSRRRRRFLSRSLIRLRIFSIRVGCWIRRE
ncbi:MAG TPA: hypothetical protein VFX30_00340 [bacterium]|nr:hypothetical protein [bacterium]